MLLMSFTSWLTLDPTSPAPIRITMVLGSLLADELVAGAGRAPFLAPTCVRLFFRWRAISVNSCFGPLALAFVRARSSVYPNNFLSLRICLANRSWRCEPPLIDCTSADLFHRTIYSQRRDQD